MEPNRMQLKLTGRKTFDAFLFFVCLRNINNSLLIDNRKCCGNIIHSVQKRQQTVEFQIKLLFMIIRVTQKLTTVS